MIKAALHLHSTYSDGEFTLSELREVLRGAGCRVACVTDHADAFDAAKVQAYVAECERLSDDGFRFVPGLEFGCEERMHVIGYGVTALTGHTIPEDVIRHIDDQGGVAVIAHPKDAHFPWIERFTRLPMGIETWNSKYDGRYAPRPGTFRLLRRLQERRPGMHAFYGIDLHWRMQFRELFTLIDGEDASRAGVLDALARGAYTGVCRDLTFPSSGRVPEELLARFERRHRRSDALRGFFRGAKRVADRLGATVPPGVKAQLRRLF